MSDSLDWSGVSAAIAAWVIAGSGLDAAHVFWAYEGRPRPTTAPYIEMTIQGVRSIGHDWSTSAQNLLDFGTLVVTAVSGSRLTVPGHGLSNGDGPVQVASTGLLPAPLAASTNYWVVYVDASTIELAATYVETGGQQPLGAGNPVTPITLTTAGSGSITVNSTEDTVPAGKEVEITAQGFREVTIHLDCFAQEGKGYDAMRILSDVVASLQLHIYALDQAGVGVSDLAQGFAQGGVTHVEGHRGGILEPRSMMDLTVYLASNLTGFDTIIESISGVMSLTTPGGDSLPDVPFSASDAGD